MGYNGTEVLNESELQMRCYTTGLMVDVRVRYCFLELLCSRIT